MVPESNLGNNFSDPEAEILNIFLKCLETHAPKQKLSRKSNFILNLG